MTSIDLSPASELRASDGLTRRVTVTPSMCGNSSLVFGQLGDWTWEAVNQACRTNVYRASTAQGQPAYLSFYYFRLRGSETFHPHALTFGDVLDVTSRVFDFGSESVLTLHRISRSFDGRSDPGPLDPIELHQRREDCLYVECLNRWITRGKPESNQGLVSASPVGFQHKHLPRLPSADSPRAMCFRARKDATFHPSAIPGYTPAAPPFRTTYVLDAVRDINGVGLMYFASYASVVDTALLRLWLELGRTKAQFLGRRVLDQRLGYFGNADVDSTFTMTVRLWRSDTAAADEIAEVALRDQKDGRLLAVAAVNYVYDAG